MESEKCSKSVWSEIKKTFGKPTCGEDDTHIMVRCRLGSLRPSHCLVLVNPRPLWVHWKTGNFINWAAVDFPRLT
jgi:hypothetical protein